MVKKYLISNYFVRICIKITVGQSGGVFIVENYEKQLNK